MTTVANIRDTTEGTYVGRAMPGKGLADDGWGNPFKLAKDTGYERATLVMRYRDHAIRTREIRTRVASLRGRTLLCWCAPKACHGDALAELADLCEHQGRKCPHCREGQWQSMPCIGATPDLQFESYACPVCKAYGFGAQHESAIYRHYIDGKSMI